MLLLTVLQYDIAVVQDKSLEEMLEKALKNVVWSQGGGIVELAGTPMILGHNSRATTIPLFTDVFTRVLVATKELYSCTFSFRHSNTKEVG